MIFVHDVTWKTVEYTHHLMYWRWVTGFRISFSMSYDWTVTKWDKVQQPDIAVHQLSMCADHRWAWKYKHRLQPVDEWQTLCCYTVSCFAMWGSADRWKVKFIFTEQLSESKCISIDHLTSFTWFLLFSQNTSVKELMIRQVSLYLPYVNKSCLHHIHLCSCTATYKIDKGLE